MIVGFNAPAFQMKLVANVKKTSSRVIASLREHACVAAERCLKRDIGFVRYPDGRILLRNNSRIALRRLHNISECNNIGFPQCDNSTCYNSNFSTVLMMNVLSRM